jgi:hypothetical protein
MCLGRWLIRSLAVAIMDPGEQAAACGRWIERYRRAWESVAWRVEIMRSWSAREITALPSMFLAMRSFRSRSEPPPGKSAPARHPGTGQPKPQATG